MPTINKDVIRIKKPSYETIAKMARKKAYGSALWKRLRDGYFMAHPLCELCLEEDKTTPSSQIHHIITPFDGKGGVNMSYMYDFDNLLSLCEYHHGIIHGECKEHELHYIYNKRKEEQNGKDETI